MQSLKILQQYFLFSFYKMYYYKGCNFCENYDFISMLIFLKWNKCAIVNLPFLNKISFFF